MVLLQKVYLLNLAYFLLGEFYRQDGCLCQNRKTDHDNFEGRYVSPRLIIGMHMREYRNKLRELQQTMDLMFIGTYLTSIVSDGIATFISIRSHTEESNQFVSFLMERYGIGEGLLRIQGIEALQLAVILGFAHITVQFWKRLRAEIIDIEVRFAFVYVYATVGIGKHIQGIFSWF